MAKFTMPSLGADMEAGTLVHWLIKPGDTLERGDIVAEVETQKGTIDVETFVGGVVQEILVQEGEHVPVGTPLAIISNGAPEARQEPEVREPATRTPPPAVKERGVDPVRAPTRGRARTTPAARKRAAELGVDLNDVTGTGPGGAIVLVDIEKAASVVVESRPEAKSADNLAQMKAAIAASMARSKREIPHYYLGTDIDLQRSIEWLTETNSRLPVTERMLYAALLLKAVALAVRTVPEMNGFWKDDVFQPVEAVHIGVAIALRGGGLVAPAIHDVEKRQLTDIMAALRDLVARARTGKLRSSELSDATITVTNLGEQGAGSVYGVIYPPQVALVGFGRIVERPWAVDGLIGIRPVIHASVSGDHRASVGHRGSTFLSTIESLLQEPEKL
jgi:pyruvate dehydrogenase E2 component (dihydrolipoamide acetyltransferase)